jgi:PIN domain nuclease of toxin-antitoxin system
VILLDTHALLWLAEDDAKLGRHARIAIQAEEARRTSAMTYWEVAMLSRKGRVGVAMPVRRSLDELLDVAGIKAVPVTAAIAADAGALPSPIHGDPADRIIIATARALGCPLVTSDRKILDYAAQGHLQAVDARR